MYYKNNKGFTLIELLVVIAIIGILAALVLVALGNARDKANDARIKSDVGQLRTIAEIIYDSNGSSYSVASGGNVETCVESPSATNCTTSEISTNVTTLTADIVSAGGSVTSEVSADPSADFCIEAQLNDSTFVCVDDSGSTQTGHTTARCSTDADTDCSS